MKFAATQLEELEKIKENLNITSTNDMTLRSILIEIRLVPRKYSQYP